MAETFEEIIKEIEQLDAITENYTRYLQNHGVKKTHNWPATDMCLDVARRVREAVGGDPRKWWVEDADGNRVQIGDDVKNIYDCTFYVFGLGVRNGKKTVEYDDGYDDANTVHKIIPDTREKIVADTVDKLIKTANMSADKMREIIGAAVDRGAKLPEVNA